MKKVGIGTDNHKVDKFKEELTKKGFTNFKVFPMNPGTSFIKVQVEDSQVVEIGRICTQVELHFNHSN